MSTPLLYKIPLDPDGKPEPGKISEMFLEFAQPLLQIDGGGPPDMQALRNIVMLAMVCWNLPLMEARKDAESVANRKIFDHAIAQMPDVIRNALLQLVEDRKTRFSAVPLHILARVEGTSPDKARIIAEARMAGVVSKAN